jgi:hypothetical protein
MNKKPLPVCIYLVATALLLAAVGANGQDTGEPRPFQSQRLNGGLLSLQTPAELTITKESIAEPFVPHDVQIGDPRANYFNVEITDDNAYMVWIEGETDGSGNGITWHCGIDPDTGDLTPPDGRGFKAYESTTLNRANVGVDSHGVYYAGGDRAGHVIVVRPTGPTTGIKTVLPTPPDVTRRAYYPSMIPHSEKDYVAWIKNQNVAGSGLDPRNSWVELQYIDLADPTNVHVIERQERPAFGFAPMDSGFFRWFDGKAAMVFGSYTGDGRHEIKEYDLSGSTPQLRWVTNDGHRKSDPYSFVFGNTEIIMPGMDFQPVTYIYTRPAGHTGPFVPVESIAVPPTTELVKPIFAQSDQPIVFGGKAYTAYQISDLGTDSRIGGFFTLFSKTGEIWVSTVLQTPQRQWRVSASNKLVKVEPEPVVGRKRAWVFYSATQQGSNILHATWQLRRADTPIGAAR